MFSAQFDPLIPSYVLSNGKSIQMVTALVLQLIQCIIKVPDIEEKKKEEPKEEVVEEVRRGILIISKGFFRGGDF